MPIQDSDLFLIQTPGGDSRSIQASVLQAGLSTTYADHFLLVNTGTDGATPSHRVRCSNAVSVVDTNSGWLLANSGGTSYRVGATTFTDYFDSSTAGSITLTGYQEYQVNSASGTQVAMPASAATADVILAIVYVDELDAGPFTSLNGFTRLMFGEPGSRPTAEILIRRTPATGTINICNTFAAAKNVVIMTFSVTGTFLVIDSDTKQTTGSETWGNIGPDSAQVANVDEYYGLFAFSARPQTANYTGAAPTATGGTGVNISTLTPSGGSRAVTYATNKLTAANGTPTYTVDPFAFSNRGTGFALFVGAGPVSDRGEALFTQPETTQWTCPEGVTSVCVVCIGGGMNGATGSYASGGGGGLGWRNNIPVVPGTQYEVKVGNVGNESYFIDNTTVCGKGGVRSSNTGTPNGANFVGEGGGRGGAGWTGSSSNYGGGGAGGYSGNGGRGGEGGTSSPAQSKGQAGVGGAGGGGGGYFSGAGGGVGVFGEGSSGNGGDGSTNKAANGGYGGSGGERGCPYDVNKAVPNNQSKTGGGLFGGGGSEGRDSDAWRGCSGAVRILWGSGREFPANDVDATTAFDAQEPMRQVEEARKRKVKAAVNYAKEYGVDALQVELAGRQADAEDDQIVESVKGVDPSEES